MKQQTIALIGFFSMATLGLPGCIPWWLFEDDANDSPPPREAPVDESFPPPSVDNVSIPIFPPLGPQTEIAASVSAEAGLTSVTFDFENKVSKNVSGTEAVVTVTGKELGEGYGDLWIIAYDADDGWAERDVTGLLVDLSPPKGELVKSVFRRGEGVDIQAWVGDAWVLGGMRLSFNGVSGVIEFPNGYPETLGSAWDLSLVTFPTTDFPAGSGEATLKVWDAAGNVFTSKVDLTLDDESPVVDILAPTAGSVVSDSVTIEVTGSDDNGDVDIDIFIAGTPIGTFPGPNGKITVDVTELAKGSATIEAIGYDVAGNISEAASIPIVIE